MRSLPRFPLLALATSLTAASASAGPGCPAPGAPDPAILANTIRYAVPPLDCARLKRKLDFGTDASSDFAFLRTVVPWYWDFLRRDRACAAAKDQGILHADLHAALDAFSGLCAGDAHPENFAVFYSPKPAAPVFGVNDPDDAGKSCPMLGDFTRLLVAAKLGVPGANLKRVIDRYIAGLAASAPLPPVSKEVKKYLGKPPKEEDTTLPDEGTPCPPEVFAKLTDAYRGLREASGVKLDPAPKLADCLDVSRSKDSGGSGGLPRYAIRFSEKTGTVAAPVVVTFKGTQKNATAFYRENAAPWAAKERYASACAAERGTGAKPCSVVAVDGSGYGFFARVKNERAIKLEKVDATDAQAVLEDEAATLANLHRTHLDDPARLPAYLERVKALRAELELDAAQLAATAKATAASLRAELAKPGVFDRACKDAPSKAPAARETSFRSSKKTPIHEAAGDAG